MATNNLPQKSIANFLNDPNTSKFLQDTLAEKKAEFVSNLITLCDSDKNLAGCDPGALMKCAMNATALNLPLNKNLGYAYIIPYNEKEEYKESIVVKNADGTETTKEVTKTRYKKVPQFQIGYKGLNQLAIRTGYYKHLNAVEIRKGEIERNKITGEIKIIRECPDAEIIGYISFLELLSGFTSSFYMSNEQLEQHALRFSKTYQNDKKNSTMLSKWSDPLSRPAMCKKTVLKALLGTYGLMTTEFAKVMANDTDNEADVPVNGERFEYAEIIQQDDPETSQPEQPEQIQHTNNNHPKTLKI